MVFCRNTNTSAGSRTSLIRASVLAGLCLCVVMQMLGVPVTLLSPATTADTLGASVLEGFTVPPALPKLVPSRDATAVAESRPAVRIPVFASEWFHPPDL